jgi:hypothetical protein
MIYDAAGTVDLISQTTATTRRDTTKTVTTKAAMIKTPSPPGHGISDHPEDGRMDG